MSEFPNPGDRDAVEGSRSDTLRREFDDTAEYARERGRGFAASARSHAQSYAEDRKTAAARSVAGVAGSLRDSGGNFDSNPHLKAFFDSAAEGLEDLAGSIENKSLGEFFDDAEAYARRAPVTVAVATFAAGFLLSRFVKSSGSDPRDEPAR